MKHSIRLMMSEEMSIVFDEGSGYNGLFYDNNMVLPVSTYTFIPRSIFGLNK